MIRHLLWDVDNVLFDTAPIVTYAICQSLNEMGCAIALNVVDDLARQSLEFCVETLAARFKLDQNLLRQRSAARYRLIPPQRQLPFPGVGEVCAWIASHGGANLIATARKQDSTRLLLSAHGLDHLFSGIFSREQGYPAKPDPAILLTALEKHALKPNETMLVGHRRQDMQAGQAAGLATCQFGVADLPCQPTLRVDHYAALLAYLKDLQ